MPYAYFEGFVGFGVGAGRSGLVRVGFGFGVASGAVSGAVVVRLVAVVVATVGSGASLGTTSTTGVRVAVDLGVGAVDLGAEPRDGDTVAPAGFPASAAGSSPTAQAIPADPTTTAAPSATAGA